MGIRADASAAGDIVQILAGTFFEQLTVSKDITLQGAGQSMTIIDGSLNTPTTAQGGVVTVGSTVTASMNDLTVTNGHGDVSGGGIRLDPGSTLTLTRPFPKDAFGFSLLDQRFAFGEDPRANLCQPWPSP